jgi:hypothetical protein
MHEVLTPSVLESERRYFCRCWATSDMAPETGGHGSAFERVSRIQWLAYDWNRPKSITPRFTMEEAREAVAPLKARVAELGLELARLRS